MVLFCMFRLCLVCLTCVDLVSGLILRFVFLIIDGSTFFNVNKVKVKLIFLLFLFRLRLGI